MVRSVRRDPGNIMLCAHKGCCTLCPTITYESAHHLLLYEQFIVCPLMSHQVSHANPTASSSSYNFQLIINNALDKYRKLTKNDLLSHPLAVQIQSCNSTTAILSVLHQQLQGLGQSRSNDERWSRWLDPTISVLYALSSTLAAGVGLVCPRT